MSYIHIKPTFDCLIKLETLEQTLNKNKIYSFLCNKKIINIVVYPISNNSSSLPFCFKFNETLPVCQKNVEIITFPKNNYLLTISPFFVGSPKYFGIKNKQLNFGGSSHTLYYTLNDFFNIKLENEKTSCEYSYQEKICNLNTKTIQNNLLIYAKLETNLGYIFCNINFENGEYSLVTIEKVDLLEEYNNNILTYKKLNDISHHGEVNKYSTNNNYKRISYIVYDNNYPVIIKHKELIPFAFFEAIKIENFKLARSYLTHELNIKLTNQHFKKFFGNFTNICLPLKKEDFEDEISLIYESCENYLTKKHAKTYKLVINNENKIVNIEELEV